ncbi:galactose-3-O-sulfotransferase 4 isoform X2 [Electrophorus electricus]|nr:galactose-3-O-sulfotransferase 4 isoform X2 [Electrophorus electricus]
MRWLGCYRLGPKCKVVLFFVGLAIAGQLLGVLFNKSWVQTEHSRTLFSLSSENGQGPPLGSCRPHTHVMFLKTHKTASSTVLNILYRFGEEQGLRFALPVGYQFGYPQRFEAQRVKGYRGPRVAEFDIIGNHMRFFKPEVEKVMPIDTFHFSILRDPVALAESSYAYYKNVAPAFRRAKGLGDFADNPHKYYDLRLRNNHYARNLLWFDFGLDPNANFSLALARRGEATVRRNFRLILISEYFDQSMVLLRHALCWPLDAVVSFSLNAREQAPKRRSTWGGKVAQPAPLALTDEQRQKLREWNALDWHLYQAFNRTFWIEVERFGQARMQAEVDLLRVRREVLAGVCLRDGGRPVEANRIRDKDIRPFQSGMVKILGYELQPRLDNVTRQVCLSMIRPEIQYKDLLDRRQFPHAQQPLDAAIAAGGFAVKRESSFLLTGEHIDSLGKDWNRAVVARNQSIHQVDNNGKLR